MKVAEGSLVKVGDKLIFAEELISTVSEEIGITSFKNLKIFNGSNLANCLCEHPFKNLGYDFDVRPFHDWMNREKNEQLF